MPNSLKTAGAVCLAAGLVSTWDIGTAQASSYTFTGQITPTENLSDVYFLFATGGCAPPYSKLISNFIPANETTSFTITLDCIYQINGSDYVGNHFSVIGLYDTLNGGVSLGFDPTEAAYILSQSPAPGFNGPWTYNDESSVAAVLQSGTYNGNSIDDAANMEGLIDPNKGLSMYGWVQHGVGPDGAFYSQLSTDPLNPAAFTLINFSGASAGGSGFVVEVVPEPATLSSLAAGALLLSAGFLWRRAKER